MLRISKWTISYSFLMKQALRHHPHRQVLLLLLERNRLWHRQKKKKQLRERVEVLHTPSGT